MATACGGVGDHRQRRFKVSRRQETCGAGRGAANTDVVSRRSQRWRRRCPYLVTCPNKASQTIRYA